jgi:hypothetical protein
MLFLLLIGLACLVSFVPLGIATAVKVKKIGSLVAGVSSAAFAAVAGYFFSAAFAVAGASVALPVVVFVGVTILCAIWTVFLFVTADENN